MKKHLGIVLFYLILSLFYFDAFLTDENNIDMFFFFVIAIMFLGWILNLHPQLRIRFLFWALIFGCGLSFYAHQGMLSYERDPYWSSYRSYIGYGYQNNISVRNYSVNRTRKIEEIKKREKERSKVQSYSGGSSHYGGGLSGGK